MSIKEQRALMESAIKQFTIPFLKDRGFKGTYPHFRKIKDDRINLLTFQFGTAATRFVVDIANCPPTGIKTSWGAEIAPAKCTTHDVLKRIRLGSIKHQRDYWFKFDEGSLADIYETRANEIISLWDEAEKWWQDDSHQQRIPTP